MTSPDGDSVGLRILPAFLYCSVAQCWGLAGMSPCRASIFTTASALRYSSMQPSCSSAVA